jgi:hypothetical protein
MINHDPGMPSLAALDEESALRPYLKEPQMRPASGFLPRWWKIWRER